MARKISIVIPTFEEGKLHETLNDLVQRQSIFMKHPVEDIEIMIIDYNPKDNRITFDSYQKFNSEYWVPGQFRTVDQPGIAYARHHGIMVSNGEVIVNFDADARLKENNALELLTNPILTDINIVLTCCDNVLNQVEFGQKDLKSRLIGTAAYEILNMIQREAPMVCFEPGMCFSKYAYNYSQGFNDVKQAEALIFSPRMIYHFGLNSKRHIQEATVIVSPRRIKALEKYGLLHILNYENAFR